MENLPLIPIEDSVVFPGMTVTLALEVGDAERVFLVPRHGEEFGSVGTVAQVADRMKLPGGIEAIALRGSTAASPELPPPGRTGGFAST